MKKLFLTLLIFSFVVSCKQEAKENEDEKDAALTTEELDNSEDNSELEKEEVIIPTDYGYYGMMTGNAIPHGIKTEEKAPDVTLVDSEEKSVKLSELYKEQPLVVIFYRGNWCPACNQHLSEFSKNVSQIEEKGAKVIAITPETYENVSKTRKNTGLSIPVYSDTDGEIMDAFDVDFEVTQEYENKIQEKLDAFIKETNDDEKAVLPVPATYVINKEGTIVYSHFDPDYHKRATVEDIVENLPEE